MKALSISQPYAELILSGKKTIETRTWNTKFRGTFLIHASAAPNEEAMQKFGFKDLPLGSIVGKAELVSVKEYPTEESWNADADKHCAKELWDGRKRYGYLLHDVQRLPPRKCKGMLNFFEVPWP